MSAIYDRDLIGYGANPPDPKWPGGARLAVNFVMNYEEGSEPSMQDGEGFSETGLTEAHGLAQRVKGHLNRVRRLSLPQPHYLAEMVAEHRLVLDALGAGDSDAAERTLRHHLRMVLSALPAIREQHPDYFEDQRD